VVYLGLELGCLYGLVALTFTAIFNATKVINFSQGEFVMLGAVGSYYLVGVGKLSVPMALVLVCVGIALMSLLLQRLMIQPLVQGKVNLISIVIGTVAVSILISVSVGILTNFRHLAVPSYFSVSKPILLFGNKILPESLVFFVTCGVLVLGYWLFLNKTLTGVAMQALSINQEAAILAAIRPSTVGAIAFLISGIYAGITGFLVAPIVAVNATMGFPLLIQGFMACIFGGIGRPFGAVLGGLFLGIVTILFSMLFASVYSEMIKLLLLFVVLLLRPKGLITEKV
jgi:branched-chain amino acid transport system permease protein